MSLIDKFAHFKGILEELGYVSCKSIETTDYAVYYNYDDKCEVQWFILDREDVENNMVTYIPRDYILCLGSLGHVELMEEPKTNYTINYSPFYYDSMSFVSML